MSNKHLALVFGIICHATFLVAVALMAIGIFQGMQIGIVHLDWPAAAAYDLLLLLQFPLLHSFLLTRTGSKLLRHLAPNAIGKELITTTYATVSAIQLILVFSLWAPSHQIWWSAAGWSRLVLDALYLGSWMFLLKSMLDAGIGVQTGYLGWSSVYKETPVTYPKFCPVGSFQRCRHPMYLAFALILWTAPVWSPDRLLLAGVWTLYLYFGPKFKDARYSARYGSVFNDYAARVPYWLPRFTARPIHPEEKI